MTPLVRSPRAGCDSRPQTMARSPDFRPKLLDGFLAQVVAGGVVDCADIAEAVALVFGKAGGQLGVLAGDDDAVLLSLVDQGRKRLVAGMAHDGDAGRLGGGGFLELLDHLLGIPVGEDVLDVRAEVGLGLFGAVVHVVGKDAACRAAGEEGDLDIFTPAGRAGGSLLCRRLRSSRRRRGWRDRTGTDEDRDHDE